MFYPRTPIYRITSKNCILFQVFYYSTNLFVSSGLPHDSAKFATIGIGCIMVIMTLISIPLMDRMGRRTLHLYGLGGMFIFSICITISFLIKVCWYACWRMDAFSEVSLLSRLDFFICSISCTKYSQPLNAPCNSDEV